MGLKETLQSLTRRAEGPPVLATSAEKEQMPDGHAPNPVPADPLPDFRLFAIVKSWMDEDVIEATVRNAFAQGADKVFVVDNDSDDHTVAIAEGAGAVVSEVYHTEKFNPRLAQVIINGVVARESLRDREPYVWWLHLDSDEFPEGPDGLTVKDYLATLDRRFRIVGADFLNHLPIGKPEYIPGFHPLDFQPSYYDYRPTWQPICGVATHWKHPLQLFDRDAPFIRCEGGAHYAVGGFPGQRSEPESALIVHHFQYREEERSRAKLLRVLDPTSSRALPSRPLAGFNVRLRSLEAVYAGRWEEVESTGGTVVGDESVREWRDGNRTPRWYSSGALEAARQQAVAGS